MALQDKQFKIAKNEGQHKKNEEEIQIDVHSLIKNTQPKTEMPISNYKAGGTSVKLPLISWLFTIPFNYVHIISGDLNKYIYNCTEEATEMAAKYLHNKKMCF